MSVVVVDGSSTVTHHGAQDEHSRDAENEQRKQSDDKGEGKQPLLLASPALYFIAQYHSCGIKVFIDIVRGLSRAERESASIVVLCFVRCAQSIKNITTHICKSSATSLLLYR
eukprot:scaffold694_cov180-Alexandrium_tamarense.AAC.12